eukprot:gnl/MRDRNA2_/MRDRNA2_76256_c0_seq2.p1 gnl/MRDRNA2_/MRDRNA2_76256_c0~~gnl/MRDRNA2_/MRDRNA2_76256_c0_seq2.p1  ORF type:complete len:453 (+),score=73.08 gnl/MRDRNA2_/MRDRNA2_76256_c0_seq2:78-1436(+)
MTINATSAQWKGAGTNINVEGQSGTVNVDADQSGAVDTDGDEFMPQVSPDEQINASASAVFVASLPYVNFALQTNRVIQEKKQKMADEVSGLIGEEVGKAWQEQAGVPIELLQPKKWKEQIDWYTLGVFAAGMLAPIQIQLVYVAQCISVLIRVCYIVIGLIFVGMQYSLPCTNNLSSKKTVDPLYTNFWVCTDIGVQMMLVVCSFPVLKLASKALEEISRHLLDPKTLANLTPEEYMKEILRYDATYGAIAVLRLDQITSSRGIRWARTITYMNFVWLTHGWFLIIDRPSTVCAAYLVLALCRLRVLVFLAMIGMELANLVAATLQMLMEGDEFFYKSIEAAKEFDQAFSPLGFPLTEMLVRSFALRDTSNAMSGEERSLHRDLGTCQQAIKQNDRNVQVYTEELSYVKETINDLENELSPSLEREKKLQQEVLQQIHVRGRSSALGIKRC